ncbi:MAG: tRNA (guanosine(37)-N1)-methyltransferase TrmD [Buchnera aphidicola (Tetraneura sorini)]
MWINIISIFPKMFKNFTQYGIISRAIKKKIIKIDVWNLRNFSKNPRKSIDDRPYGGGVGMVMTAPPLLKSIRHVKSLIKGKKKIIYLSPQGKILNQHEILKLSKIPNFILVCGRYKGIDERIIEMEIEEEYSIGNYIISGGELAAMVFIDALTRSYPGVLGKKKSFTKDSFYENVLDYPNYTRPKTIENKTVPKVLLSGNHEKIKKWRRLKSLKKTLEKYPNIIKKISLTNEEKKYIYNLKKTTK